jgi:CubicO group peptidase (beta-lactamase class C family)
MTEHMISSPPIDGTCDPRFAPVRDAFAENFVHHDEIGAAVAIAVDGRVVVDLWGGHADEARRSPWRRDTLVNVFSAGKGLAALSALVLADRGMLDLDAAMTRDWPEFGASGKATTTVRQVLSHRAGLPAIRRPLPEDAMLDWTAMTTALAGETPWWPPGVRHGYHVNTFGFLVGEIVRRISGRTLGAFLREEIAGPLGADVHVGLSGKHEARVADIVWNPEMSRIPPAEAALTEEQRMIRNTYFNPPGLSGHGVVNTSRWRRAEIPSTNAHATARGIARIYAALAAGGSLDGIEIVGRETLAEAVTEHSAGHDAVLNRPSRFGLGFQLPHAERPIGPNAEAFGHFGAGGALGFADPKAAVGFGYVMNRMGPRFQSPTNRSLVAALYSCL